MKIVYCSNTGHTKEYARLLANELNIDYLSVDKLSTIDKQEEIIYLGWVFASHIMKLNKVSNYQVKAIIAVGMNMPTDDNKENLIKLNNILDKDNFFYLQGGIDYNKLKGFKKFILKMVGNKVIKENKEEDKEIIEIFKNGGDFVKKENLDIIKQNYNIKISK